MYKYSNLLNINTNKDNKDLNINIKLSVNNNPFLNSKPISYDYIKKNNIYKYNIIKKVNNLANNEDNSVKYISSYYDDIKIPLEDNNIIFNSTAIFTDFNYCNNLNYLDNYELKRNINIPKELIENISKMDLNDRISFKLNLRKKKLNNFKFEIT